MVSFKPFVLLFDDTTQIFTDGEAEAWMKSSNKIIFLGTSFSVITSIALNYAVVNKANIEIVDLILLI